MHSCRQARHSAPMTTVRLLQLGLQGVCASTKQEARLGPWTLALPLQHSSPSRPHQHTPISHSSRPRLLDIVAAVNTAISFYIPHRCAYFDLLLLPAPAPPAQSHDRADTRDCWLFVAGILLLRHSHQCERGTQRHANDDIAAGVVTYATLPELTDRPTHHHHSAGDLGSPTPRGGQQCPFEEVDRSQCRWHLHGA